MQLTHVIDFTSTSALFETTSTANGANGWHSIILEKEITMATRMLTGDRLMSALTHAQQQKVTQRKKKNISRSEIKLNWIFARATQDILSLSLSSSVCSLVYLSIFDSIASVFSSSDASTIVRRRWYDIMKFLFASYLSATDFSCQSGRIRCMCVCRTTKME